MKRYIDVHIPVTNCNLKCEYCYVSHQGRRDSKKIIFKYDVDVVKKALSKERLGGICLFNLCGEGETLIPKEIIEYTRAILENGHYVMIVTNGILKERLEELAKLPKDFRERIVFKLSFHYLELKNKNLLETFKSNLEIIKKAGMSYTIEMTPTDELEPYIEEIKKYCIDNFGALCHVTIPRNMNTKEIELLSKHSIDEFYVIWKVFESELLDFKYSLWGKKRKEFCYAGDWSGLLNLGTGDFVACYEAKIMQNIFENTEKPINFISVGCHCKLPHCYNGHSYLALGDIPEINAYKYGQLRDRVTKNGEHWLNNKMRKFLNERLQDDNKIYCKKQKKQNEKERIIYYGKKFLKKLKSRKEVL